MYITTLRAGPGIARIYKSFMEGWERKFENGRISWRAAIWSPETKVYIHKKKAGLVMLAPPIYIDREEGGGSCYSPTRPSLF